MPAGWAEELHARWPHLRLFNCYGLTEFTSVSHLLTPEHAIARGETVGRPVAGVRQQVVGEDERPLPSSEPGEVWLSGPMRMQRYWGAEQATGEVFRGDWLRTGDLGAVDGDGFLTLLGRAAEVINRGGEKVHAAQVEAALCRLESVAEAAVVGAPHPVLQEAVVACVVLRRGHELDEENAREHHRAVRARLRAPRSGSSCSTSCRATRPASSIAAGCGTRSPSSSEARRDRERAGLARVPAGHVAGTPDPRRRRGALLHEGLRSRHACATSPGSSGSGPQASTTTSRTRSPILYEHRQLDDGRAHGRRRGGCSPRSPRPS